jgi:hypothetical protein
MDVPIKHIIGTVALIGLVICACLAYIIITSYVEADVTKQQLKQVSEDVAMNLVEIANLVNFANLAHNNTLMRILDVPLDLGGKAYMIQLVDGTNQGHGYYVSTCLVTRKNVNASSQITLNSTQAQLKLVTDSQGILYVAGDSTKVIQYDGTVYGGARDFVVWGWKGNGTTTAGIGLWKKNGG